MEFKGTSEYISTKDLSSSLSSKLYENAERKKLVLYIAGSKLKISGNSSYIIIDDRAFQMARTVSVEKNDLFIPANDFFNILKSSIMPEVSFDPIRELLEIDVIKYDITDILIDVKSNGTIIKLKTKKPFSENGISSFINKHGWYYLTISGGIIDTSIINSGITTIGFSTYFLWPSGSQPVIPSTSGAIHQISFTVHHVGAAGTQLLTGASLSYS